MALTPASRISFCIRVSMTPGWMALTWMLNSFSSLESCLVRWVIPAFATMYGVKFGRGVRVVAILMIFPAFFSIRVGMTALEQRKAVVRFPRMVSSHSLSEISWIGAIG